MSIILLAQDSPRVSGDDKRGALFDYVSPSRLNLWLKCPLAFRFRYLDGIRSPATPALFLGKSVHAALAFWYEARQSTVDIKLVDVEHRLSRDWDRLVAEEQMAFDDAEAEATLKAQAWHLVSVYLAAVPADEPLPLAVEIPLEASLVDPRTSEDLGVNLFGILDLVVDDHAGPTIVDFKTVSRGGTPLEILHEMQLSCYAYLYRATFQNRERGVEIRNLIKTKTPKIEYHRWPARSDAHFGRLFAVLRAYLDCLDARRFVFRPGWGCSSCEFRDTHCHGWCG